MAFSKIAAENLGGSTLPALAGGSLTGISGGKLLQTQSALFTSQTAHSTTSFTDAGYTDQITPSATNSKIFVQFNFRQHTYQASGVQAIAAVVVYRQINGGGYSLFYPANGNISHGISVSSGERVYYTTPTISFLDTTHNTTNAIDYKLYAKKANSTSGSVNVGGSLHQAQVILMEISA